MVENQKIFQEDIETQQQLSSLNYLQSHCKLWNLIMKKMDIKENTFNQRSLEVTFMNIPNRSYKRVKTLIFVILLLVCTFMGGPQNIIGKINVRRGYKVQKQSNIIVQKEKIFKKVTVENLVPTHYNEENTWYGFLTHLNMERENVKPIIIMTRSKILDHQCEKLEKIVQYVQETGLQFHSKKQNEQIQQQQKSEDTHNY